MKPFQNLLGAALMTVAFVGGGAIAVAQSADTAPVAPDAPVAANTCRVDVDRSNGANTFSVKHETLPDDECVCHVLTGPADQSPDTEARVADVLQRGCNDRSGPPVGLFAAGAGAVGIAAILASSGGNDDSPGG